MCILKHPVAGDIAAVDATVMDMQMERSAEQVDFDLLTMEFFDNEALLLVLKRKDRAGMTHSSTFLRGVIFLARETYTSDTGLCNAAISLIAAARAGNIEGGHGGRGLATRSGCPRIKTRLNGADTGL